MENSINKSEDMPEGNEDVIEKLRENPIDLIKENRIVTIDELKERYGNKNVLICDVYVEKIENEERKGLLFRAENIHSIDHHAPLSEFEKKISSTNLAIKYVRENGPIGKDFAVVTNHTDADSIMATMIMRGILPPDEKFGEAAIAADHTGEKNEIADLLQAVQYERDIEFSARNLQLLIHKMPIEERAKNLLEQRNADRKMAERLIIEKKIEKIGDVSYVELEKKIDPNFFIMPIPEAMIIVTFSRHKDFPENLEARIRLGSTGMEKGLSLLKLGIEKNIDPNWGGRWNAGSDKRAGGTNLSSSEYAAKLNDQLQKYLKDREQK